MQKDIIIKGANENNLNKNLELLFNKLLELESAFADHTEGENNDL